MSVAVAAVGLTVQWSHRLAATLVVTGVVQKCLLYLRHFASVGSLALKHQVKRSSSSSLQRHFLATKIPKGMTGNVVKIRLVSTN